MANEFIARNGVIALANSTISGSLSVTNSVSGSTFTGSFVGGLTGTSSYASVALTATSSSYSATSSFAATASFATLAYSASYFSGSISNAVFATSASFAATASYALNAGAGGGGTVGGQALLTQSLAATTWSFNHNLGTTYPVVTVYDSTSNTVIIPQNIVPSGSNDMKIYFSSPKSGYATAVAGGGYFVTNNGTTRKLVQSTPAVTWSFVHNIGDQYPAFEIYDSNNNIVIPANIRAVDTYTAEITFAYSASGTAVATLGGGIGVGDVITIPSASSAWSIQHNLNTTYPIVTIWESGSNQIVQPDTISSVDANNILVTFTTPVKGFANVSRAGSVISGSTDWNLLINKPNVGVVYSQTTPSATWSIAHNLGTQFPLVTVYDSSNAVVLPQSIVGTDSNNITITFPTAQTGTVNVSKAGNYISGSILWSNITSGPFSTTGSVTNFTGSLNITGSLTVSGSGTFNNVGPANFTGSLNVTGSLNTIGTITATTLVVQTITSSISSITGSTKFGSLASNTHQFTGSMFVTGGFYVTSGSVGLGTTNISAEANLFLGAQGASEGGQIVLQRGTSYASASHLDNYQDRFRIMRGNDTGSTAELMTVNMATGYVGIGTSSPTNLLHVSKDLTGEAIAFINNTSATGFGLAITAGAGSRYALSLNDYASNPLARFLANGNVLIGTTTDNSIAALQINGGVNASLGFKYTYSLGTIAQNTTITQSIPSNGAGFYLISNGGNNSALFMITRAGGSLGCQLVFSTNSNGDIVCGTTSEPAGGNYLRLWMSSAGVLSIKNVNAYTGPYYLTAIGTF